MSCYCTLCCLRRSNWAAKPPAVSVCTPAEDWKVFPHCKSCLQHVFNYQTRLWCKSLFTKFLLAAGSINSAPRGNTKIILMGKSLTVRKALERVHICSRERKQEASNNWKVTGKQHLFVKYWNPRWAQRNRAKKETVPSCKHLAYLLMCHIHGDVCRIAFW